MYAVVERSLADSAAPHPAESPRVSVVVPVHNGAPTIEACLQALLNQSVPPATYEIIIVDDGSTDGTYEKVLYVVQTLRGKGEKGKRRKGKKRERGQEPEDDALPFSLFNFSPLSLFDFSTSEEGAAVGGHQLPTVTVLRQPLRGPAAARNLGARHARGELLLFTDADCAPAPNWIEHIVAPFTDQEIAAVKGCYRTRQRGLMPRFVQIEYESKYDRLKRHATIPFVDGYAAAYRKRVFEAADGFDPTFPVPSAEDIELSFRLARQGHKMVFAPDAVVYHRHNESLAGYLRRKFTYGYWRVLVYRRHPDRVVEDTHTPQTLKLQVIALPFSLVALAGALIWPPALMLFLAISILFWLSALPLIARSLRRDIRLGVATPFLVLLRAGALASGLATGVLGLTAHAMIAHFRPEDPLPASRAPHSHFPQDSEAQLEEP